MGDTAGEPVCSNGANDLGGVVERGVASTTAVDGGVCTEAGLAAPSSGVCCSSLVVTIVMPEQAGGSASTTLIAPVELGDSLTHQRTPPHAGVWGQ